MTFKSQGKSGAQYELFGHGASEYSWEMQSMPHVPDTKSERTLINSQLARQTDRLQRKKTRNKI